MNRTAKPRRRGVEAGGDGSSGTASGVGAGPVPELLDIETLAQRLNDSVRHVRRLVAERRIPYLKVGHFIRFDPREVNDWLAEHRVRGRSDMKRWH